MFSATISLTVKLNFEVVPREVFALITTVPTPTADKLPFESTVAIESSLDSQEIAWSSAFDGYAEPLSFTLSPTFIFEGILDTFTLDAYTVLGTLVFDEPPPLYGHTPPLCKCAG